MCPLEAIESDVAELETELVQMPREGGGMSTDLTKFSCLSEEPETSHKLIKAGFGSFQEVEMGNDFYYSEIALV